MKAKSRFIKFGYIFFLLCISGIIILSSNLNDDAPNVSNHVFVDAKIDNYTSLSDVEADSDIIVSGTKVYENEPTIITDENGNIIIEYTLSEFKIDDIIQNNLESSVQVGDTINILENEFYDEDKDVTYHIAGYCKMITDNEYMLFLRYADQNKWYIPTGVTVGKIPLDADETLIFGEDNTAVENVENIVQKARNKYNYKKGFKKTKTK